MIILTTAILLVTAILVYITNKIRQIYYELVCFSKLPGPPANNLILGNITALFNISPEQIFEIGQKWTSEYYPLFQIRVLSVPAVVIVNPEDAELILSNPAHTEKSIIYNMLHDWLGTGLLTSKGQKWHARRKILTSAFHFSILQKFVDVFNEEADQLVESFKTECHKTYVEINEHTVQFTLKSIAETAMGVRLTFTTENEISYKTAIMQFGKILFYRLIHSWLIFKPIFFLLAAPTFFALRKNIKILHKFTRDVIMERQKNFKESDLTRDEHDVYIGKKKLAMLDLMLSAKYKDGTIDDEGIREEVDTFMFEGHDTTAMALNFALMLIACHKYTQNKIVQEMLDVLGDINKKPTYNDFQELKYLERTIKEVLRIYPSVPFISRNIGEDLVTHSGYCIPKNSLAHIPIYCIHRNPEIYPVPEKFDPDRFLPENSQNRHPFAYLPFSAGSRNCIGQKFAMLELKAAICGVLANFILEPVDDPSTIVLMPDLVLRTKDAIKIKFVLRVPK